MSLFRPEAIEGQRRQLHGAVTIYQPVSFAALTAVLAICTVSAAIFLTTASFARKETASGWVVPQMGMAQVYAPQGSIVQEVMVHMGQSVKAGQVIAVLSSEIYDRNGGINEQQSQQLRSQMTQLDIQIDVSKRRMQSDKERLRGQIAGLHGEADIFSRQRLLQIQQLKLAEAQHQAQLSLAAKGFISKFELDRRLQLILQQQQAVDEFDRQIESRTAQIEDLRSQISALPSRQQVEEAQLRGLRADIEQSLAANAYRSNASLRAPSTGVIAAVNIRAGETVSPTLPAASIAPVGPLEAELLLPTRNAGFIRAGQPARILVDAFPFQRFGALTGHVVEVSHAATNSNEYPAPIHLEGPAYRVRVELDRTVFEAYGASHSLQSGMTLQADITADRRTLLQWLLDPLLAARRSL